MRRQVIVMIAAVLGIAAPVFAQYRVDPKNRGERIIVVVPLVGTGQNMAEAKWPLFVPLPSELRTSGIHEFTYQLSDDGRYAIVEFAGEKEKLEEILKDNRTMKAFQKGKHRKDEIERELKQYRRTYALSPVQQPVSLPGGPR